MANLRVIAEIKPAGDFPVVDAPNVSVTGGKRLDVALSEAAAEVAKKANKSEVDAALAGKANKSEVDAAIENKADKSAFEAINASVSVNTSNIQELSTESTVLSARMDEFTKLKEGSTTGDAELIDGRVGADGKTYDNIGGAIRGQVADLKSDESYYNNVVDSMFISGSVTDLEYTTLNNFIISGGNGKKTAATGGYFNVSSDITVTAGTKYYIRCSASNTNYAYAFYDSSDNLIRGERVNTKSTPVQIEKAVIAPYGAVKLVLSLAYTGYARTSDNAIYKRDTIPSNLVRLESSGTDIEFTSKTNYILNKNGKLAWTSDERYCVTDYIDVSSYKALKIIASSGYSNGVYAFYDKNKVLVSLYNTTTTGAYEKEVHNFVPVPNVAKYIVVNYSTAFGTPTIQNVKIAYVPTDTTPYNLITLESDGTDIEYTSSANSILTSNGKIAWNSDDRYCVTNYIDVSSYKALKIVASSGYSNGVYAFYDENKVLVSIYKTTATGAYVQETHNFVPVPHFAKYLVVNYSTAYGTPIIQNVTRAYAPTGSQNWKGIKWVVFGDSLTESNSKANKHYYDYISEETGITVINHGVSGTGYAKTTNNFYTRVNNLENVDFDIITFFGSFNDLSAGIPIGTADDTELTTLGGYINATLDRLYAIKPFVKVGIVTPTPWFNNGVDNTFRYYAELLVNIGKKRSIPVLDLYSGSQMFPWNENFRVEFYKENGVQDEGVHPNSKGHQRIHSQFREFLAKLI